MPYDAAFPHLFNPLANQRVLVGVQIDVVGDRLVDEIAARTVLRGGQCIKRVDLFDTGAEADGFLGVAHNTRTIACIIVYYKRKHGPDFDCETWLHKARALAKEDFRREVERRKEEPSELNYFKVYESQIPVIEQAIETATLMLGTDKSRAYRLEMICADFLAGAHLDNGNPEILLASISRYYKFLPGEQQLVFLDNLRQKHRENDHPKAAPMRLDPLSYEGLRQQILRRDGWRCQFCVTMSNLEVHHREFRSHSGENSEENLITLCSAGHARVHGR